MVVFQNTCGLHKFSRQLYLFCYKDNARKFPSNKKDENFPLTFYETHYFLKCGAYWNVLNYQFNFN